MRTAPVAAGSALCYFHASAAIGIARGTVMDIAPHFRTELYPPLEPNSAGRLALDRIHTMYWEESGNPRGVPVVFFDGGPGAGSAPSHRRVLDTPH